MSGENSSVLRKGIGLLAFSALVGWFLGGLGLERNETPPAPARSAGVLSSDLRPYALPPSIEEKLRPIRKGGSVQERLAATLQLAESLSTEEFRRWVEHGWFDVRSGYELALFHRIGFEKWIEKDSLGYVAWARKEGREDADEVLVRHLQGDRARLDALLEESGDQDLELNILSALGEIDPEQAVTRARDLFLKQDPSVPWWFSSVIEDLVVSAPEELSAHLDQFPRRIREWAKEMLVTEQLKHSFDETLADLMEQPDGFGVVQMAASRVGRLGDKLLERMSELPPQWKEEISEKAYLFIQPSNAAKWLEADLKGLGLDEGQVRRLTNRAIQALGDRDPMRAIEDLADSGLSDYHRENFLERLLYDGVPEALAQADWLARLAPEDRKLAEGVLADRKADRQLTTAETWMKRVENPIEGDFEHRLVDATLRWSQEEVERFHELLPTMTGEARNSIAELFAETALYEFKEHTVGMVGDALRHVITQEESSPEQTAMRESVLETTSLHAVNWVLVDPAAATRWVATLPAGPSRDWAEKNMGSMWSRYDQPAAEAWIAQLPGERAAAVRRFMSGGTE